MGPIIVQSDTQRGQRTSLVFDDYFQFHSASALAGDESRVRHGLEPHEKHPAAKNEDYFGVRKPSWLETQWDLFVNKYLRRVIEDQLFKVAMMGIVLLNMLALSVDVSLPDKTVDTQRVFEALDAAFVAFYLSEFFAKLGVKRMAYWRSQAHLFDFSVLVFAVASVALPLTPMHASREAASILKLCRSFRALRLLRSIAFQREMQVLVFAVYSSIKEMAVYVVLLLMLVIFVFATLGVYVFRHQDSCDSEDFPLCTLSEAYYALFVMISGEGWTTYHDMLAADARNDATLVRAFSALLMLCGNFMLTNFFVAANITDAHGDERARKELDSYQRRMKKRAWYNAKLLKDISRHLGDKSPFDRHKYVQYKRFLAALYREDSGADVHLVPMHDPFTDFLWVRTYVLTMDFQEMSLYKVQQLQFQLANVLAKMKQIEAVFHSVGDERDPGDGEEEEEEDADGQVAEQADAADRPPREEEETPAVSCDAAVDIVEIRGEERAE